MKQDTAATRVADKKSNSNKAKGRGQPERVGHAVMVSDLLLLVLVGAGEWCGGSMRGFNRGDGFLGDQRTLIDDGRAADAWNIVN
ncbi:hypothetical protein BLL42_07450 [Pseudomonas frederiksbergensis]|uniref:Uncharacterized protein n=1 Tax=Pseudomonas frederiksbergensis TaxID=104087 RepID=A0A1J0EHP8_9PSED|nr:hypothetical protein BLL42_07450 [Pseudomonas frederiksbergensis]